MNASTGQYSDAEVIHRIKEGETALFEILIRRYNPYLYRVGRTYHYTHADTEDLMQETYVHAYFNLSGFQGRSSFKTWLTRIMLNNCYQKKQRLSHRKEIVVETSNNENDTPVFHGPSNTENIMINRELGNVLEQALNQIPEDYRIVFTLRELNGLSVMDTHEALNLSESNVKVRLSRAKKMLRSEIEKMYSPEEIYEFNLRYCDGMVQRVMAQIGAPLAKASGN